MCLEFLHSSGLSCMLDHGYLGFKFSAFELDAYLMDVTLSSN